MKHIVKCFCCDKEFEVKREENERTKMIVIALVVLVILGILRMLRLMFVPV
ncbi:MAG: hypothetical protein IKJ39_09420 [Lachnospiraceae bacterium]|nr:hypothetical protein [Lachnospiraceae bacterium]